MPFTLNGIGTKYYGTRWLPDGTYITTEWIVVVYAPIIPIGSVRVFSASQISGSSAAYGQSLRVQEVPLDIKMVLGLYAWVAGGFAALAVGAVILSLLFGQRTPN